MGEGGPNQRLPDARRAPADQSRGCRRVLKAHDMPVPKSLEGATRSRLLIVDDDPRQLAALQRALKPHADRMEVQTVDNGIEALVQWVHSSPIWFSLTWL